MISIKKQPHKKVITVLTIEEVLETILPILQLNFGICFIILSAFLGTCLISGTQGENAFYTHICSLNSSFLTTNSYSLCILGIIVLIGLYLIIGAITFNPRKKFGSLVIIGLIILCAFVFVTGGILDSPFTVAVGVYVSFYFIIQERKDLKLINFSVLITVILFIAIPYYITYIIDKHCDQYIIRWNSDFSTNIIRLIVLTFLIAFTGYSGELINRKLTDKLYLKNKIQKNEN